MDTGDRCVNLHRDSETTMETAQTLRETQRPEDRPRDHRHTHRLRGLGQHSPVDTWTPIDSRTLTDPCRACPHRPSSSHQPPRGKEAEAWWEGRSGEIPGPFPAPSSGHQSLSRAGSGRPRPQGGTEEGGWPLEAWAQALTYGAEGELSRWMRVDTGHQES